MITKKNVLRGLSAFALGVSLFAQTSSALAGREHVVRIVNNASQNIFRIYASNVNRELWGRDRLGESVLMSGYSVDLNLDDGSGRCRVDLKVVFRSGGELIQRDVNICNIATWHIDDHSNGFTFASF